MLVLPDPTLRWEWTSTRQGVVDDNCQLRRSLEANRQREKGVRVIGILCVISATQGSRTESEMLGRGCCFARQCDKPRRDAHGSIRSLLVWGARPYARS